MDALGGYFRTVPVETLVLETGLLVVELQVGPRPVILDPLTLFIGLLALLTQYASVISLSHFGKLRLFRRLFTSWLNLRLGTL